MSWARNNISFNVKLSVADPGFDLTGGVDFINGGKRRWGLGGRKSVKVFTLEV